MHKRLVVQERLKPGEIDGKADLILQITDIQAHIAVRIRKGQPLMTHPMQLLLNRRLC